MEGDGKMRPDEVGEESRSSVTVIERGLRCPDLESRLHDMGFCHLLDDAREAGDEIELIGKNIFRAGQGRPAVDEILKFEAVKEE